MRTTNFRRGLVLGVGTLLSGALLTTGTAYACPVNEGQPGESSTTEYDPNDLLYPLDEYAESDGSLYPESDNGVMAGPDGQGDYRNGFPVPF
jgi:hypothetical protein